MKILLLGYSRFIQKRIVPALETYEHIAAIDIASSHLGTYPELKKTGTLFNNYDSALAESDADIVYISTVNSTHAQWIEKALDNNKNIVVDKPATLDYDTSKSLVERAKEKNLILAESTIYAYHPQIEAIRNIFREAGSEPERITGTFLIPPLNDDNFRYKKELGGGALWDMGVYAISPGRLLFGTNPDYVDCKIITRDPKHDNIDIGFSLLATYPNGKSLVGQFGFTCEYKNHLHIAGSGVSVEADRIFTTPPNFENELHIKIQNHATTLKVAPADNFLIMLDEIRKALQNNTMGTFGKELLADAEAIHLMMKSAKQEK